LSFIVAGVGAYLGAYLKKKGENLATREDIKELKEQVAMVTRTTEEIKTEISDAAWNRQRLAEMKREVLFEAIKRLAENHDALKNLAATVLHESMQHVVEEQDKWLRASADLDKANALVGLICGRDTHEAFKQYRQVSISVADQIMKNSNDAEVYPKAKTALATKVFAARAAARKELGIPEIDA
jgi:hypothetical protein